MSILLATMEITNLAEAEWVGPLVAILVIAAAIILARIIRKSTIL